MKIASWNVNSIRLRIDQVVSWLEATGTDVLLLQETKVADERFPLLEPSALGYTVECFGESQRNGVAILARRPLDQVRRGLPGDEQDHQARWIEARIEGLTIACLYLPNGTAPESPNFAYKLRFLERLRGHLQALLEDGRALVIGGDYNIAPEPLDVYDPRDLEGDVCYRPEVWRGWRGLVHLGLYDAFRVRHPERRRFTHWAFKGRGFELGEGMRIDHFLLSGEVQDRLQACEVDTAPRAENGASDHAPIWIELS